MWLWVGARVPGKAEVEGNRAAQHGLGGVVTVEQE
jgi:hypothetical protein